MTTDPRAQANLNRLDRVLDIAAAQPIDPEHLWPMERDNRMDAYTYLVGALAQYIDPATFDAACQRTEAFLVRTGDERAARWATREVAS